MNYINRMHKTAYTSFDETRVYHVQDKLRLRQIVEHRKREGPQNSGANLERNGANCALFFRRVFFDKADAQRLQKAKVIRGEWAFCVFIGSFDYIV